MEWQGWLSLLLTAGALGTLLFTQIGVVLGINPVGVLLRHGRHDTTGDLFVAL